METWLTVNPITSSVCIYCETRYIIIWKDLSALHLLFIFHWPSSIPSGFVNKLINKFLWYPHTHAHAQTRTNTHKPTPNHCRTTSNGFLANDHIVNTTPTAWHLSQFPFAMPYKANEVATSRKCTQSAMNRFSPLRVVVALMWKICAWSACCERVNGCFVLPRQPGVFGQDFTIRPTPSHFSLKFNFSPFLVSYNGTHQPMGQTGELVRCMCCSWGKKRCPY